MAMRTVRPLPTIPPRSSPASCFCSWSSAYLEARVSRCALLHYLPSLSLQTQRLDVVAEVIVAADFGAFDRGANRRAEGVALGKGLAV